MSFRVSPSLLLMLATASLLAACQKSEQQLIASGRQYLEKNELGAGVIEIKQALDKNPSSGEARALLGQALLKQGDPAAAELELVKALELKAPEAQVLPDLARALLAQGRTKALLEQYGARTLDVPRAHADLRTTVATARMLGGDFAGAEADLAQAMKADANHAPAKLLQVRLLAANRQYPAAKALVEEAIKLDPRGADGWRLKGDLLRYVDKDLAGALAAYRQGYAAAPHDSRAHLAATLLQLDNRNIQGAKEEFERLKKVAPGEFSTRFIEAQLAYAERDNRKARELLQQLQKVAPNEPRLLQLAAAVELQGGSVPLAEGMLNKVLLAHPQSASARLLLVRSALQRGDHDRALTLLAPLMAAAPDSADANALAAEAYLQAGDGARAEVHFRKASQANPDNAMVRTALALRDLGKGRTAEGFEQLRTIAAQDPGTVADMALIASRLGRKEYDEAAKAIEAMERKPSAAPLAATLMGRMHLAKQDVAAARKSFERALSLQAGYQPAVQALTRIDIDEGQIARAVERYEALAKAEPKNAQVQLSIARLQAMQGASGEKLLATIEAAVQADPANPAARLARVEQLLNLGRPKEALAGAQEAVAVFGERPELLDALGRTQATSGDYLQAITSFSKLASLQPESPIPHVRIAEVYRVQGKLQPAIQSLRRAIELDPQSADAQRRLMGLLLMNKRSGEALAVARDVQRRLPKEGAGFVFEGDIHMELRQFKDAITAYQAALSRVKSANQVAIKLHAALGAAGKHKEAGEFAADWEKTYPRDASFRFYLGDLFTARQQYAVAEAKFRDVIALQPTNAFAYNNLAWALVRQNKPEAVAMALKATELRPNQPPIMDTLASAYEAAGQLPKAIEVETKALEINPALHDFRLRLARWHLKTGQPDAAKAQVEPLLKLGDKYRNQDQVLALAKELKLR